MIYRALTIAREYGSGGSEIASLLASSLGWKHVDRALLTGISNRARRVQARLVAGADVDQLLRAMDERRLEYVRRHYGENRLDPHLYDLLINSHNQPKAAARLILSAMETGD